MQSISYISNQPTFKNTLNKFEQHKTFKRNRVAREQLAGDMNCFAFDHSWSFQISYRPLSHHEMLLNLCSFTAKCNFQFQFRLQHSVPIWDTPKLFAISFLISIFFWIELGYKVWIWMVLKMNSKLKFYFNEIIWYRYVWFTRCW